MATAWIRIYMGRATDDKSITDPAAGGRYYDLAPVTIPGQSAAVGRGHLARIFVDGKAHFTVSSPVTTATTNSAPIGPENPEFHGVQNGDIFSFITR